MRKLAAVMVVSVLVLCAPAAFSLAQTVPDNGPKSQGADNAATKDAKTPSGGIDNLAATKDIVSRTIASFENDIRDAYHRELIRNPKIDGELSVSFTVQPGGDVADVKIDGSSLNWPPLEEEILNKIRAWKFPPFEGRPIPAQVPYKFSSK